ncbi:nucleotidyltransferase family protein [Pseudomonas sp. RIT-To-2]|uniref:nucleotidyltransferase family protein n=1 Tax=Pseudomonas sp. RIT-To-2 TaxID=3462541 RepID=UPI0024131B35
MKNSSEAQRFDALVLGADRHAHDPVTALGAAGCKALTPIDGIPMLHRVVTALQHSEHIGHITLVGPSRTLLADDACLHAQLAQGELGYLAPDHSPAASVRRGLAHQQRWPVLVTTADHALLRTDIVDHFLAGAAAVDCDVCVAVTPLATVLERFPGSTRTAIRLKGGAVCGSNLFAFMTPRGASLAQYWTGLEAARKHPRSVVAKALGPLAVLKYLLGQLSLAHALAQLSNALGVKVGAVVMPFAEAAVDVDSAADFALVERTLGTTRWPPARPGA